MNNRYLLVAMFLLAIVLANLSVALFGPSVSILNAFLLIGLDLTSRDRLHDLWNQQRGMKMLALIATGALLTAIFNAGAARIGIASTIAFTLATAADWLSYELLREQEPLVRMNGSNLLSAAIDSLIFPLLAFGLPVLWTIVVGQYLAKVFGGVAWSLLLQPKGVRHDLLSR